MPNAKMLFRSNPFKVFGAIVGSDMVDVMNVVRSVWPRNPASSYGSMQQYMSAKLGVPILSKFGFIRLEFSKNFPALGDCKTVVVKAVLNTIENVVVHVRPLGWLWDAPSIANLPRKVKHV